MNPRAAHLIASLGLTPHREGGYFREIHRSAARVTPGDGRPERAALTTIYYLLPEGTVSRWHRVSSDEAWHYYEGDAIELWTADAGFERVSRHQLGPSAKTAAPVHVVPAGVWQAACSTGAYSLAGCTVGPGFEFDDFDMLRDQPVDEQAAARRHPDASRFV
jgi:uncharacterized protein